MKRWIAEITYDGGDTLPFDIEELDELRAIVESGPDWNLIDEITIKLNKEPSQ